jgi:hypothetical protein
MKKHIVVEVTTEQAAFIDQRAAALRCTTGDWLLSQALTGYESQAEDYLAVALAGLGRYVDQGTVPAIIEDSFTLGRKAG